MRVPGSVKPVEELFPYRSLREVLAGRRQRVHSVAPLDTVERAVRLMARFDIGLLVVLDGEGLAGVLSERDIVRRAGVADGGNVRDMSVATLMTRDVATVGPDERIVRCLELMDARAARHLPVVEGGRVVAVVSIRDLLHEAVKHHRRIVSELDRLRLAAFQPLG